MNRVYIFSILFLLSFVFFVSMQASHLSMIGSHSSDGVYIGQGIICKSEPVSSVAAATSFSHSSNGDGKLYLSYPEVHMDAVSLVDKIRNNKEINKDFYGILAVARGGLVPAAIISYKLGVRTLNTISISSYSDDSQRGEINILKDIEDSDKTKRWLVVDDLVDSGETFKFLRKMLPNSLFVTVYAKPKGVDVVDIFCKRYDQDTWIEFPWEVNQKNSMN